MPDPGLKSAAAGTSSATGPGKVVRSGRDTGPRSAASRILAEMRRRNARLESLFNRELPSLEQSDQKLCRLLVQGSLRWYGRLQALRLSLSKTEQDPLVQELIHLGLYQLLYTRTAPHAAVAETVEASRLLGRPRAAPYINGCLRRFLRERIELEKEVDRIAAVRYSYPPWFLRRLNGDWGQQWQAVAEAGNERAPLWVRVNRSRISSTDYRQLLRSAGLAFHPSTPDSGEGADHPWMEHALRLESPVPAAELPGYEEGLVSIQDLSAQRASPLLDLQPGLRVLDACCGSGGKSAHLLELSGGRLKILGIDSDRQRLDRARTHLQRLGFEPSMAEGGASRHRDEALALLQNGDATSPLSWWDGDLFDRILLDAPCSASGTVRRHPDAKWRRGPGDIRAHALLQSELLRALWPLLKPGGLMLYTTCSIFDEENSAVVASFFRDHQDASDQTADMPGGHRRLFGVQQLPRTHGGDGFYYALLAKAPQGCPTPLKF